MINGQDAGGSIVVARGQVAGLRSKVHTSHVTKMQYGAVRVGADYDVAELFGRDQAALRAFPELIGSPVVRHQSLTMEVGAIMDGISLNSLFNPEGLSAGQRRRYLRLAAEEALRTLRMDRISKQSA